MNIIEKINEVLYDLDCADNMSEEYKKLDSIREYLQHCGALVPVPVGGRVDIDRLTPECLTVLFKENVYVREKAGSVWWTAISRSAIPQHLQSMILVQPVDIVPLKEADI